MGRPPLLLREGLQLDDRKAVGGRTADGRQPLRRLLRAHKHRRRCLYPNCSPTLIRRRISPIIALTLSSLVSPHRTVLIPTMSSCRMCYTLDTVTFAVLLALSNPPQTINFTQNLYQTRQLFLRPFYCEFCRWRVRAGRAAANLSVFMPWLNKSPWSGRLSTGVPSVSRARPGRPTQKYRAARLARNNGISAKTNEPSTPRTEEAPASIILRLTVDKYTAVIHNGAQRVVAVCKISQD